MVGAAVISGDCVVAPGVAQIYTGSCCHTGIVCVAVVCKALVKEVGRCALTLLFGREHCCRISAVGEGVGNSPTYVGLFYIRDGLPGKRVGLVEEETAFPVGEFVKLLAVVGQHCTAGLNVLFATANPCTLGTCYHVGIHIVLLYNVLFCGCLAVVPVGRNCSGHLGIALIHIVDVAAVDTHHVGKYIEVVGVVVTAIDVGAACNLVARAAPHLCHIGIGIVYVDTTDGVPHNNLLAKSVNVVGYYGKESLSAGIGVGDGLLVGTNVYVGCVGKDIGNLVEHVFEYLDTLIGLHIEVHCALECLAVAGHIYFGDNYNASFLCVCGNLAALLLCVVVAGKACH